MKKYICISLLLLAVCYLQAQEKKWSLQECMKYAVENNLEVSKQREQNNIYKQDYLQAIGRLLPTLNAATSTRFNFGRGIDGKTNTYVDVNSFSNNYELYTSLTLFDGLANVNNIRMQKVNKLMGKNQLQTTQDQIAYNTMESFFNVLYYMGLINLGEQQLADSQNTLKQAERMEELGLTGLPDVAEIRVKEASDAYNLTKQRNLYAIAIIVLKDKMNYPIDEELVIDDYASDRIVLKLDETTQSVYSRSLSFLPEAQVAESSLKAKELSYKIAKGSLMPSISANAGYSTNFFRYMDGSVYENFNQQLKNKKGQYIGLTLSIPIFNGFSRFGRVKTSKAQLAIARSEKEEILRKIYSEVEQAVTDMNGQVDEYYQSQRQVEAMHIAHKMNTRKYEEGLISAMDLHTSSNRLLQAKIEELNAQLKYYLKQKLVDYYKGVPYIAE